MAPKPSGKALFLTCFIACALLGNDVLAQPASEPTDLSGTVPLAPAQLLPNDLTSGVNPLPAILPVDANGSSNSDVPAQLPTDAQGGLQPLAAVTVTDPCKVGDPCNAALRGGTCQKSPDGKTAVCSCNAGWLGLNCKTRDPCLVGDPCNAKKNQGSCQTITNPDGKTYKAQCNCNSGWVGPSCAQIDYCARGNTCPPSQSDCVNDATSPRKWRCQCKPGAYGPDCVAMDCSTDPKKLCTNFAGWVDPQTPVKMTFASFQGVGRLGNYGRTTSVVTMSIDGRDQYEVEEYYEQPMLFIVPKIVTVTVTTSPGRAGWFNFKIFTTLQQNNPCAVVSPAQCNGGCAFGGTIGYCPRCPTGRSGLLCEKGGSPAVLPLPTTSCPAPAFGPNAPTNFATFSCGASTPDKTFCTVTCAKGYRDVKDSIGKFQCSSFLTRKTLWTAMPICYSFLRCQSQPNSKSNCPTPAPLGTPCTAQCPNSAKTRNIQCVVNAQGTAAIWSPLTGC